MMDLERLCQLMAQQAWPSDSWVVDVQLHPKVDGYRVRAAHIESDRFIAVEIHRTDSDIEVTEELRRFVRYLERERE